MKLYFLKSRSNSNFAVSVIKSPVLKNQLLGYAPKINEIDHKTFVENKSFRKIINDTISKNIHNDVVLQGWAYQQKNGYLNIQDERCYVPWGRVPDPEDIFGTVLLSQGKIGKCWLLFRYINFNNALVEGSFEQMPTHRMVSANGMFKLSEYLESRLIEEVTTTGCCKESKIKHSRKRIKRHKNDNNSNLEGHVILITPDLITSQHANENVIINHINSNIVDKPPPAYEKK
ncbi:hypothetical protein HK099_001268 [Clydaea vesicula]|uniref:Uncharacterized protein n=1 Tax=Clydaea vesicula TaxID=447962 RepID=A0AAD5XX65_9FUNG|nr:hypothetical protein HK099_001268 [Clydaea vesicula]